MPRLSHIEIIRKIAKQTDLSTSSVYKILHNPFDFSLDTAKRVMQLAEEYGYSEKQSELNRNCRFSVLIPSRPSYYWREAMSGMRDAQRDIKKQSGKQIELLYNYIHLRLGDEAVCRSYKLSLDDDSDGYIIFPSPVEECNRLISEKSREHPVILFNECHSDLLFQHFPDADELNYLNIASVSLDNIEAGRAAFRLIEGRLNDINHFVFINTRGDLRQTPLTSIIRMESCRHELLRAKPDLNIDYINIEFSSAMTSSILSRKLYDIQITSPIDCVYITTGVTHLASSAIAKLRERLGEEVHAVCIGHEYSPSDKKYMERGIQIGYIKQNVYTQGYDAVMMLWRNLNEGLPLSNKLYRSISYSRL
ncbi:MAG: LacI family DNA-binding transcriptional regulator [Clostridia bacterium]|nr:LacI family DNA-binding transcriptional regulator [Clostridia bacterium]